ncbi:MAG TPA: 2-dehydro-3-deoxy-D-gluconate 5-dehydrogenase KduD [Aggregatilinea sp.]|uniref:2-dehydro-3-deoxy-D-gluconate 5-dehydrogenase KduD n=1 Tax=Aggregatilinea sp. TaxID=2806333 RepID=UPI002C5F4A7E|nr:2-dehydro-3-deoxy-D-gluconate 5-dehydrogenase KduD [Aggregatilinea sp.]HML20671.1 2-dehydro-3-deoxy-D-gluconate 5-dehydrogenase KduD [Aggregatilinea sp.]
MGLELFDLHGKVALVTGASRGLGQGMAVALAEAGADIAGLDRTPDCDETCALVEALGRHFLNLSVDLLAASAADLRGCVQQVVDGLGRLDILVNNAGIIRRTPAMDFSEEDWNAVMDINLRAAFFLTQAAARVMREQGGGKVINVASMLSFQGGILVPSYTASKSGIAGLTRALANEWAGYNINVNAIAPGYMATDNTAPLRADAARSESILGRIPAGRWGTPADLKGIVILLASEAGAYMNGAIVPVDGGWLAR